MDTSALLSKWRHLIEPELLRCATPLRWVDLELLTVGVLEREHSVLVTKDSSIGGEPVRTVLVAAGRMDEIPSLVQELEEGAKRDGLKKIMFVGRRGWLHIFPGYREIAVIGAKVI